jgi:hypothetical protein
MGIVADILLFIIVLQLGWIRIRLDKVNDSLSPGKVQTKTK